MCPRNPGFTYFGYQAHITRKRTALVNLQEALDSFSWKYGRMPRFCFTDDSTAKQLAGAPVDVQICSGSWVKPIGAMLLGDEEGV